MKRAASILVVAIALTPSLFGETGVKADGDLETAEHFTSTLAHGSAPLVVSSTTPVPGLNTASVDGLSGSGLDTRLTAAETSQIEVLDQATTLGPARPSRTGLPTCYNTSGAVTACGGSGQDAEFRLGVAWPNPRLTDNGDGTVTDNLTGLVWLADAACLGPANWTDALAAALALFDGATIDSGGGDCGLTDGSSPGAWRLPNVREIESLIHRGFWLPTVTDTAGTGNCDGTTPCAFSGVMSVMYWSSTTLSSSPSLGLMASMTGGQIDVNSKTTGILGVWPVRNAQ